jgi:pimeloyl-ACP methyl ester carboxylesterase
LLVWSPGYISGAPGGEAASGPSTITRAWLLEHGYALAGSKPTTNGWAVEDLLRDQEHAVDVAADLLGEPETTIAWGNSMGGLTSAALIERHPDTFDGALPMCASVAGGVGMLNQSLDAAFAFKTLLAPDDHRIELVEVDNEPVSRAAAQQVLDIAQATPEGRSRIALAAAFAQLPGWTQPGTDRPGAHDWEAQQEQQYAAFMFSVFSPRAPLEARAGGNFSWNTEVDYHKQLAASGNAEQVRALYRAAGLDLDADLAQLETAPRIAADSDAAQYMHDNATPTGAIDDPVLTLHETGDTAPTVTQARAYAEAVAATGNRSLLRQSFVDRPGHCDYTPAEQLAALITVEERIDTGHWRNTATAASLNTRAKDLDAQSPLDLGTAGFTDLQPHKFARAYYPAR